MNVIRDKSLEPFHIEMDELQYIVRKTSVSKKGKTYVRAHGFYSTLGGAVKEIMRLKAVDFEGTLAEYVERVEKVGNEIIKRIGI